MPARGGQQLLHCLEVATQQRKAEHGGLARGRAADLDGGQRLLLESTRLALVAQLGVGEGCHQQRPPVELARCVPVGGGRGLSAGAERARSLPLASDRFDHKVEPDSVDLLVG